MGKPSPTGPPLRRPWSPNHRKPDRPAQGAPVPAGPAPDGDHPPSDQERLHPVPHVYDLAPAISSAADPPQPGVMRNLWREGSIEDNEEYLRSFGDAANCCDCGVCGCSPAPWACLPQGERLHHGAGCASAAFKCPEHGAPRPEFVDERKTPTDRLVARWAYRPTMVCTPTPASPWSRRRYSSRSSSTSASLPCLSRPWATR